MNMFSRFVKDESGATAIEYGLIAAIVSVGIIVALGKVSGSLQSTFNSVSDSLNTAAPAAQ
jgi:pilus assembly protein Flp/PilA